MKKRIVVFIALLLVSCFALSGCAQSEETNAEVPEESVEALEEPIENIEEYMEWGEPEDEEVDIDSFLALDGMEILAMAPFVDGVGWVQYMSGGEMITAAVDTGGRVLLEIPGPVWYVSPFESGYAYAVISDNATYYQNADTYTGCYEQVVPAMTHEVIYSIEGYEMYSTSSSDAEEHILCMSGGKFVTLRHESGLDYDWWTLGTIDWNGDVVDDFQSYEGVDGKLVPTWKTKYSGTKKLPCVYGVGYGNNNDGDQGDGFSRYIGGGVYYLTGNSHGLFYQPEKQLVTTSVGTRLLSDSYNGKVLVEWNGKYYTQDVDTNDGKIALALQMNEYEDIGNGRIFHYDHLMPNNLYYHDHGYYDVEMNRVIQIEEYTSLAMDGSVFNEGYALIFLVGVDGNTYVTVIDEEGAVQFEPIQAERTSGKVSNGCFVVRTDTECAVYNVHGNYLRHLCDATEAEYFRDISGGYVTMFGVVGGKAMNRICALLPLTIAD